MAMDFSAAIDEIMPLVNDGDKIKPFIITRDGASGDWEVCYPEPDEADSFTISLRKHDPYTAKYYGADFDGGSMPYVYDKVLCDRLRNEYNEYSQEKWHSDAEKSRLCALITFFEDNIKIISHMITDYLIEQEQPFLVLEKICPFYMATGDEDWVFYENLATGAIEHMENAVYTLLHDKKDEPVQNNKHIIEGYEEKQSVQVAGQLVILAENQKADEHYLVCYCKWDNPFGINEYYNACVTDDYTEALSLYANGILSFTQTLEKEMADYEQPPRVLTAKDCLPDGLNTDLTGALLIYKAQSSGTGVQASRTAA